jgi:hypothetical protein
MDNIYLPAHLQDDTDPGLKPTPTYSVKELSGQYATVSFALGLGELVDFFYNGEKVYRGIIIRNSGKTKDSLALLSKRSEGTEVVSRMYAVKVF